MITGGESSVIATPPYVPEDLLSLLGGSLPTLPFPIVTTDDNSGDRMMPYGTILVEIDADSSTVTVIADQDPHPDDWVTMLAILRHHGAGPLGVPSLLDEFDMWEVPLIVKTLPVAS
jgi:hypothetical protein